MPAWGCFSSIGPGPLVKIEGRLTGAKYIQILESYLLPYIRTIRHRFPNVVRVPFLQDRSPIHTSLVVRQWLQHHADVIEVIPWPAKGADLNPIEKIWGDIVKDFNARHCRNQEQVFDLAAAFWFGYANRDGYHLKLAQSMRNRLQDCITEDGYWTKY